MSESAKDEFPSKEDKESVPNESLQLIYSSLAKARESGESEYAPKDEGQEGNETQSATGQFLESDNTGKVGETRLSKSVPLKTSDQFLAGRLSQALSIDNDKPRVEPENRNRKERREALRKQTLTRALRDRQRAIASGVDPDEFDRKEAERPAKPKKNAKNVFTRMEHHEGPFSLLYRSARERLKVKVWTRSYKHVRGICTGYIIAFDTHFNLVMADVDEVFKPIDTPKPRTRRKKKRRQKNPREGPVEDRAQNETTQDPRSPMVADEPDAEPMSPTLQVDGAADSSGSDADKEAQGSAAPSPSGSESDSQGESNSLKLKKDDEEEEDEEEREDGEGEGEAGIKEVEEDPDENEEFTEDFEVSSSEEEVGSEDDGEGNTEDTSDDEEFQSMKALLASLKSELHELEEVEKVKRDTPVKCRNPQEEESDSLQLETPAPSSEKVKPDSESVGYKPDEIPTETTTAIDNKLNISTTQSSVSKNTEQEDTIVDVEELTSEEMAASVKDTERNQPSSTEPMETDIDPNVPLKKTAPKSQREAGQSYLKSETIIECRREKEETPKENDSDESQLEEETRTSGRAHLEEASSGKESGECSDEEPLETHLGVVEDKEGKVSSKSSHKKKSSKSKSKERKGKLSETSESAAAEDRDIKAKSTAPMDLRSKLRAKREAKTDAKKQHVPKLKSTVRSQVVVKKEPSSVRSQVIVKKEPSKIQLHESKEKEWPNSDESDGEWSDEERYSRRESHRHSLRTKHYEEVEKGRESRSLRERGRCQESERPEQYWESERRHEDERRKETDRSRELERYREDDRSKESERHKKREIYREEEHLKESDRHRKADRYKEDDRLKYKDRYRESERELERDHHKQLDRHEEPGRLRRDDRRQETERHRETNRDADRPKETDRYRESERYRDGERPRETDRHRDSVRHWEDERQKEIDRQRERHKEGARQTESDRHRSSEKNKEDDRQREIERHTNSEKYKEADKVRESERNRDSKKYTEGDRQRDPEIPKGSDKNRDDERQRRLRGHESHREDIHPKDASRHPVDEWSSKDDRWRDGGRDVEYDRYREGGRQTATDSRSEKQDQSEKDSRISRIADSSERKDAGGHRTAGDRERHSKLKQDYGSKYETERQHETKPLPGLLGALQIDLPSTSPSSTSQTPIFGHSRGTREGSHLQDSTQNVTESRIPTQTRGPHMKGAGPKRLSKAVRAKEAAERRRQMECKWALDQVRGTPLGETGLYQRHLNQVMIRGDNVVMVAIVQ